MYSHSLPYECCSQSIRPSSSLSSWIAVTSCLPWWQTPEPTSSSSQQCSYKSTHYSLCYQVQGFGHVNTKYKKHYHVKKESGSFHKQIGMMCLLAPANNHRQTQKLVANTRSKIKLLKTKSCIKTDGICIVFNWEKDYCALEENSQKKLQL